MNLVVIKIGGSLMHNPPALRKLCETLSDSAKKHQMLVVPGGGEFADAVRSADRRFSLSNAAAHRMAILGMDQYGLLLADLTPNSAAINTLDEIKTVLDEGKLPIFLPSQLMLTDDPLENSWAVTSDAIAAYLAVCFGAQRLLLLKDVDGIFTADPKRNPKAKLLQTVVAKELLSFKASTGIDSVLPRLLCEFKLDCWVVNGLVAQRVVSVLDGQDTVCTRITYQ
ncbi:MAG: delta 1-pyrroline-5-carboxylate synthetase [Candidatus Bathyarchaeota archaeon]|nr:delta 1-pyrroline-5-carboxylate synthetase [Candidatus Bathyarchaeota archaeon]